MRCGASRVLSAKGKISHTATVWIPFIQFFINRDEINLHCNYILSFHAYIWDMIFTHVPASTVYLTHWGRATHTCVGKLTIIGSDNGLSPARRQAIIWTIAGILLIGPLETNFNEILIGIQTLSFKKMHLKMSHVKWRPFVSAPMY